MQLHPEGGWYKESYRSPEIILGEHLPNRYGNGRNFYTAIYFLLEGEQFSSFHRIKSDEMWHFYYGDPLQLFVIDNTGNLVTVVLGSNLEQGNMFQYVVKAGYWFAAKPAVADSFSLVGCTVAPGFDFEDFELAKSSHLSAQFPQHQKLIHQLCRS